MEQMELPELLRQRESFTLILQEARAERNSLDSQILDIMRASMEFTREGTHELSTEDGPTVIAKTTLNRTVSPDDVRDLRIQLREEGLVPAEQLQGVFKTKYEIDLKQLRDIEANNTPLYARICRIMTSKPRAPALTVRNLK